MDVDRLSQGEKIAAGSAIALFIVMFFSWFGAPDEIEALGSAVGVDTSANAWQSFDFIDLILLATVIVAIGAAVAKASANRIDFPLSTVVTVLGALSTILVLYRIIDPPGDADRKFGVFLGVILAALLTYGGWLAMQEEGTTFQDAADRFGGGGPGDPGAGAPPGPGTGTAEPPPPPPPPPPPADPPPPPPPSGPPSGQPPSA
jgi:hypothetical protein